jgi:hypothetical protein
MFRTAFIAATLLLLALLNPIAIGSIAGNSVAASPLKTPISVTVTDTGFDITDTVWTKLVGIGTLGLALATFGLAWYTRSLSNETRASLKLSSEALEAEREARIGEEWRHQDGFMPHLALIVEDQAVVHKTMGGGAVKQVMGRELYVRNVGVGPALNTTVAQTNARDLFVDEIPLAIAAGDKLMIIRGSTGDERLVYCLTYEDVYGRQYSSDFDDAFVPGKKYAWHRPEQPTRPKNLAPSQTSASGISKLAQQ